MQASIATVSLTALFVLHLPLHPALLAQVSTPAAWCDAESWHRDCSTPGVHLALVEEARIQLSSGIVVSYGVAAANAPTGRIYSIWNRATHGPAQALLTGLTADTAGNLICADSTQHVDQPIVRAFLGWCGARRMEHITLLAPPSFALGEAMRVALISTDGMTRVYADAIPYPLEASSGSCTVVGEMMNREMFAFSGSGFMPAETLHITSRSGRDVVRRTALANPVGRLETTIILPAVRGKKGGDATFEVAGAACQVALRYGWGDKLYGPGQ
jgi:hypothetical protein